MDNQESGSGAGSNGINDKLIKDLLKIQRGQVDMNPALDMERYYPDPKETELSLEQQNKELRAELTEKDALIAELNRRLNERQEIKTIDDQSPRSSQAEIDSSSAELKKETDDAGTSNVTGVREDIEQSPQYDSDIARTNGQVQVGQEDEGAFVATAENEDLNDTENITSTLIEIINDPENPQYETVIKAIIAEQARLLNERLSDLTNQTINELGSKATEVQQKFQGQTSKLKRGIDGITDDHNSIKKWIGSNRLSVEADSITNQSRRVFRFSVDRNEEFISYSRDQLKIIENYFAEYNKIKSALQKIVELTQNEAESFRPDKQNLDGLISESAVESFAIKIKAKLFGSNSETVNIETVIDEVSRAEIPINTNNREGELDDFLKTYADTIRRRIARAKSFDDDLKFSYRQFEQRGKEYQTTRRVEDDFEIHGVQKRSLGIASGAALGLSNLIEEATNNDLESLAEINRKVSTPKTTGVAA